MDIGRNTLAGLLVLVGVAALTACGGSDPPPVVLDPPRTANAPGQEQTDGTPKAEDPAGVVTLAFAGDMHFERQLAALLERPRAALGSITRALSPADLTMVNLETSITHRGTPEQKELEVSSRRYHFRTSPAALDFLDAAGVDVVTMGNNHGADFGDAGLEDTLRAIRNSPVPVLGIGGQRRAAFKPYRVSVRGTDFAFLAADSSMREGASSVWAAGPETPGVAAARGNRPRALLDAVRSASQHDDVVVVYLHWGAELQPCPTPRQRDTARALAEAGADVIVGSHAHVLLGSGWMGNTYVNYGLGNFLWYHDHPPESGVLRLRIAHGEVVGDAWIPARIGSDGRPLPLRGQERFDAVSDWRRLRGCTGLAPRTAPQDASPTAYSASVWPIGPAVRKRMRYSHHPGCPVPLSDLRYLRLSYVAFDGNVHTGEMVIHEDYAQAVTKVFEQLYEARWPIRRMRLVDDFGGSDDRSMAANNTSGYNCRRVAGIEQWSTHAKGEAIDINPLQNPYVTASSTGPPAGWRFVAIDRSARAPRHLGVIRTGDVVVRAFARIGWEWGGDWSASKDYQHFSASGDHPAGRPWAER